MSADTYDTVGFIDVGTNSIHVLVVRFYRGGAATPIFADKEPVRLGKTLYSSGAIDDASIAKCSMVVSRFVSAAKGLGASEIVAYATCAAREASNSDQLISVLRRHTDVKVISGREEARLIALGVFGPDGPKKKSVVLDIGGGSTEVVLAKRKTTIYCDSLALGTIRLAYGLGIDCTKKVSDKDYRNLCRYVEASSYHAVKAIRDEGYEKFIGSSGTMLCLAEMCGIRRGDGDASRMTLDEVSDMMKRLRGMDAASRLEVPGMGKNRADIIITGGAIAETLMRLLGADAIEVSQHGLKQGMQTDYVMSKGLPKIGTREASVMALAERCHYDRCHAGKVQDMALRIYDRMSELGIIDRSPGMRELLGHAALLHDIGEFVSYENHHLISQSIIGWSDLPGFTNDEIRAMGLMVRLHHKKMPSPKDPMFAAIPRQDLKDLLRCAGILRMADILDGHRTSSVYDVGMSFDGKVLTMSVHSDTDPGMEIWRLEKLRPDFKKVFGYPLAVSWARRCRGLRSG